MEPQWNDMYRVKPNNIGRKTCPSVTLSNTNPTWVDLNMNLGLYTERQVIKCLRNDMALVNGISHSTVTAFSVFHHA
jgi:hypothetical protein